MIDTFKSLYRETWLWLHRGATSAWRPTVTTEMKQSGLTWGLASYKDGLKAWIEVCDFCHGNCGQCGITGRVGNPGFSLAAIIKNGRWDSGAHAGLPLPR